MKGFIISSLTIALLFAKASGFAVASNSGRSTLLQAATEENDDFLRWARQSRSADVSDNVVELVRPLGLVLNEDERGNVYVEKIAPRGNAARTGKVRVNNSNATRRKSTSSFYCES